MVAHAPRTSETLSAVRRRTDMPRKARRREPARDFARPGVLSAPAVLARLGAFRGPEPAGPGVLCAAGRVFRGRALLCAAGRAFRGRAYFPAAGRAFHGRAYFPRRGVLSGGDCTPAAALFLEDVRFYPGEPSARTPKCIRGRTVTDAWGSKVRSRPDSHRRLGQQSALAAGQLAAARHRKRAIARGCWLGAGSVKRDRGQTIGVTQLPVPGQQSALAGAMPNDAGEVGVASSWPASAVGAAGRAARRPCLRR
jgi:hypothetical protein